jgi:hypothetical protein
MCWLVGFGLQDCTIWHQMIGEQMNDWLERICKRGGHDLIAKLPQHFPGENEKTHDCNTG